MKLVKLLIGGVFVSTLCFSTLAQSVIANRTALDTLLGSNRSDENFESLLIGSGAVVGPGNLSATNNWGGLDVSGITLESLGDPNNYNIQLNGPNFRGASTRTIAGGVGLKVDFWNPADAFGVELKDSNPTRSFTLAGITIYGGDDTTVLYQNNSFDVTDPANGTFFGYEYSGGIGSVVFAVTQAGPLFDNFSPYVDNLSFSTAPIPEPSTLCLSLLSLGLCFRRFRKK